MKLTRNLSLSNEASYFSYSLDGESQNHSKNSSKNPPLDLKKLNLTKDPALSTSSLQLLILLLNRSLKFSLEQILGLFTNNSKYLAHLIVKGVNDKFQGLRLFFQLVHSNIDILLRLFKENQNDGLGCLYALKPGFISKDQRCAGLTIDLFQYFGGEIYEWFASKESKCSQTLILGLSRHENLSQKYAKFLFSITKGNEVEYFSTIFIAGAANEIQLLQNISKLIQYFPKNEDSLVQKLENNGVFEKWFEVGKKLYESEVMDDKLIFIDFIGDFMLYLPEVIEKNASVTNLLRRNWQHFKMAQFVPMINQILINLQKLARKSYPISRKLLKIIVDIFNQTIYIQEKRQFIIHGFFSVLTQFPRIQSEIFITNYPSNHIVSTSDFMLFLEAVEKSDDYIGLIKIADFLKDLFFYDTINNQSLSGPIIQSVKKIVLEEYHNAKGFCYNLLKSILSNYVIFLIKSKSNLKIEQNQQKFNSPKKKNSEKQFSIAKSQITILNKKIDLTITLAQKIIDIIMSSYNSQQYIQTLKSYFLVTNSEIKKNNFGMGAKRIVNLLQKKLKVTKQQETMFEEQYQSQSLKSTLKLSESLLSGKPRQSFGIISSLSRIQVPDRSVKQIDAIIARRKRDEQIKAEEEAKRKKEYEMKKILYKKELQKMKLIKGGFGEGEAQLKEEGFWNRFIKQTEETKVYLSYQIEDSHLQAGEIIMKRYSKLFKYLFTNYSNTMHSSRTSNFTQNLQKKERLSHVEIIKFLKDYQLILVTNLQQVQILIKDINIKIYKRRQLLNEVDFQGFQQFIKQFCLCVWSRNLWRLESKQNNLKYDHLTLPELLMNFIIYLRNVFKTKGQNMSLFDVGEAELKNFSSQIQELNDKLEINPNHILPEGFKKIADKKIEMKPFIKTNLNFPENYAIIMQVLDSLIFDGLGIHIIEPYTQKVVKFTAKSLHQINVRDRDPLKIKARVLSTIIDRKSSIHSISGSILTKFQFSKGIRKGMLLLKPGEKIIGEQVAYKLQQILNKVSDENEGENSPNKIKKIPQFFQPEVKKSFSIQKLQSSQNNYQPLNSKLQIIQKTESYMLSRRQRKLQQQRKSEEKVQKKLKIKRQQDEKYFVELKLKLQEKKQSEANQFTKLRAAQQRERQKKKQKKQRIQEFTSKQVEKYKNKFEEIIDKKRKLEEELEIKIEDEQEKMRRIRQKIDNESKIITQIRKETTQTIMDILYGQGFKALTKQYQVPLKVIFDYMLKYNANPLSKKKISSGQIDAEMWSKFNKVFELSPLIVAPKDVVSIFKIVTKEKKVQKQYSVGLNYQQFLHCLLRQCIKQKTIFGKIAERIKDQKPSIEIKTKKSKSVNKKIQTKNQFQQQEETNIKKLLKEPDIREDIIDHYGDVSKFSLESFKGLIFYLKMPFTKKGQQTRIKELIEIEKGQQPQHIPHVQKLKEKLKAEYRLQKNQKRDTINSQDAKPTEKVQTKIIKLQTKTDLKEKQQNKTLDLTKSIKQKK